MISVLVLPDAMRTQLAEEARNALPRECCGLVEGTLSGVAARAIALHPARNLAGEPDRFEIDPPVHIALLRGLRGTDRQIIGCYHSHPNGRGEPSVRDCAAASESGFLWLIAAVDSDSRAGVSIVAFVSRGGAFSPVRIASTSLDRVAAPPL